LGFLGDIGNGELLIILVVALVALGPDRFPAMVKKAGKVMGDLRRAGADLQRQVREEIDKVAADVPRVSEVKSALHQALEAEVEPPAAPPPGHLAGPGSEPAGTTPPPAVAETEPAQPPERGGHPG
jgi:sec-independent protein translocase protein TatB